MLNAVTLYVIMLSVITQHVIMLNAIMLNVISPFRLLSSRLLSSSSTNIKCIKLVRFKEQKIYFTKKTAHLAQI